MSSKIDILIDGHVHTKLCNHAVGEMEEYVCQGIVKGLREICFLEHLEAGIDYNPPTWLEDKDFDYYVKEGKRLKEKYSNQITITLGLEVGFNPLKIDELQSKIAARKWERIGVSCHFLPLPDSSRHLNLLSRKPTNIDVAKQHGYDTLLSHYFDNLILAINTLPATVLCHLDAALRFAPGICFKNSHFSQIADLLDQLAEKRIALEINTSGIPIRKEPFPTAKIVKMALDRNIELQAGSDAHRPEDVARNFSELPDYINSILKN